MTRAFVKVSLPTSSNRRLSPGQAPAPPHTAEMHLPRASLVLAALLPTALAGSGRGALTKHRLHVLAKEAGLKYFGSATDSPGQRERAGLEAAYPQYDAIMWESGEFGQTTPTNGMKVR